MLVNLLSSFRFAHGGIRVVEYLPGPAVDLPEDAAEEALREGLAELPKEETPPIAKVDVPVKLKSRRRK